MGSRAGMLSLRALPLMNPPKIVRLLQTFSNKRSHSRIYSTTNNTLQPPHVPRLAQTARISLTPLEVEEYAPKINQVIDWFGQLQAIDLESIDPAIRAETEVDNFREDIPETFANREVMIAAVPSYTEPFIKVPKVLNKE